MPAESLYADPVVAEIHEVRRRLLKENGGDVADFRQRLRERQCAPDRVKFLEEAYGTKRFNGFSVSVLSAGSSSGRGPMIGNVRHHHDEIGGSICSGPSYVARSVRRDTRWHACTHGTSPTRVLPVTRGWCSLLNRRPVSENTGNHSLCPDPSHAGQLDRMARGILRRPPARIHGCHDRSRSSHWFRTRPSDCGTCRTVYTEGTCTPAG